MSSTATKPAAETLAVIANPPPPIAGDRLACLLACVRLGHVWLAAAGDVQSSEIAAPYAVAEAEIGQLFGRGLVRFGSLRSDRSRPYLLTAAGDLTLDGLRNAAAERAEWDRESAEHDAWADACHAAGEDE